MLGISPKFNEALASVAGALAFKVGVLNLMTVRSRFISGDMKTGRVKAWEEDERTPEWLRKVFKFTLVISLTLFDPLPPRRYIPLIVFPFSISPACLIACPRLSQRLTSVVHNAIENEPFFLAVAAAIAIAGKSLVPYKVLIRAAPYLGGVFTMFALAGASVSKA
ncbi:MAG: hypothetical protein SGPRY_009514 [Prymnesium sp.]